jgi:hypothetical protein
MQLSNLIYIHNATSMRAFAVETRPQRKRRRRAWPGLVMFFFREGLFSTPAFF